MAETPVMDQDVVRRATAGQGRAPRAERPAGAAKATTPELTAGMSVAEAFKAVARSCLRHLLANVPLFSEARDPEAVHQMRVAVRRLRAALALFKDVVADECGEAVKAGLRRLASEFGDARDLDVFIGKTIEPAVRENPDDAALAELSARCARRRDAAYGKALDAVTSGRLDRIVLDTLAWVEAGPWLAGRERAALRDAPAASFAARELSRRAKRIRKRAAHIEELEPEARHRVRIAVKKLRYAAEFFAPLYEGKGRSRRAKAFRAALGDLQDRLGDLNDIAVGAGIAEDSNGADPAVRLLAERQASRFDEHLAAAQKAYRDFIAARPFWR
jgi:CHAD domain-containing protein